MNRKYGFTRKQGMSGLAIGLVLAGVAYAAATFTVGNVSVDVGAGAPDPTMNFPVTRSGDTSAPVTVGYATVDGTAVASADYGGLVGSITIPAGSASGTIPLSAFNYTAYQPDRQFSVVLMGQGGNGPLPSFGHLSYFKPELTLGAGAHSTGNAFPRRSAVAASNGAIFPQGPMVVGDFNGDGKPDVADATNNISIFLNSSTAGAPAFASAATFTNQFSSPLIAADFNGDGLSDLAGLTGNGPTVLVNTTPVGSAAVTFSLPYSYTGGTSIAVADFNGDGKPDLVSLSDRGLNFELNTTPSGASTPSFTYYYYPIGEENNGTTNTNLVKSIVVGDFDGDGRPDIALVEVWPGQDTQLAIVPRLNTTPAGSLSMSFAEDEVNFYPIPETSDQISSVGVFAADVNNDGKTDLVAEVTSQSASGEFPSGQFLAVWVSTWMYNRQYFGSAVVMDAGLPLAAADFNGDGKIDLVTTGQSGVLPILMNVGPLSANSTAMALTSPFKVTLAGNVPPVALNPVVAADFDGDGKPDLAFMADTQLAVALNTTQPSAGTQLGEPGIMGTGDIHYQSNVPGDFYFNPVFNADPNTSYISDPITLQHLNVPTSISVTGGQYSINGGPFTASAGTLQPTDSVRAQAVSSPFYQTTVSALVTIGGVGARFAISTSPPGSSSSGGGSSSGGSGSSGASSSSGGASSSGGSSSGAGSSSGSSGGHGSSSGSASSSSGGASGSSGGSSGAGSGSGSSGGHSSSSSASSSSGGASGSGGSSSGAGSSSGSSSGHGSSSGGTSSSSGGNSSSSSGSGGGGGGAFSPLLLLGLGLARLRRGRRRP